MAHILHIWQSLHNLRLSSTHLLSSLVEFSKDNYSSVVSAISSSLTASNIHVYSRLSHFKLLHQILQENLLLLFSSSQNGRKRKQLKDIIFYDEI